MSTAWHENGRELPCLDDSEVVIRVQRRDLIILQQGVPANDQADSVCDAIIRYQAIIVRGWKPVLVLSSGHV